MSNVVQLISRHVYIGTRIDGEVVHRQARDRMNDGRAPESTVVHHHGSNIRCAGREHTVYTTEDKKITDKIFVDDGYAMWGVDDPRKKR